MHWVTCHIVGRGGTNWTSREGVGGSFFEGGGGHAVGQVAQQRVGGRQGMKHTGDDEHAPDGQRKREGGAGHVGVEHELPPCFLCSHISKIQYHPLTIPLLLPAGPSGQKWHS